MTLDELITQWTVRAALAFYVLSVAGMLQRSHGRRWERIARWTWTLGCGFYLAHVVAAFHFYHGWSHTVAYRDTARKTAEVTGFDWGGGLYFNYAFTVFWLGDVVWWWCSDDSRRKRPRSVTWCLHGFLAFIALNATVVFETGALRWLGLAAIFLLGIVGLKAILRRDPSRLGH